MGIDLDLRRLRFFVEVVQQGGFSAAAKKLFATQSTVSKAVKQLEEELGVVLLQRSSVRTDLTDEGRVVFAKAAELLAASDRLKAELDELKGLRRGLLTLGLAPLGTSTLLADALASFKLRHPMVDLKVEVASVLDLHEQLLDLDIEIAALFESEDERLEYQLYIEDHLMVLLPASNPLATTPTVDLRALQGLPLFLYDEDVPASRAIAKAFEAAGVSPHVAARSSHLELLYELVKSGAGASFVPSRFAASRQHRATVAVPLADIRIPWRLGFAWLRSRYLSHAARAWLHSAGPPQPNAMSEPVG
ncbi:LysR family transcriptional regulator [Ramlibacter sp. AN1133]|uniref:LysR family transcriptional regulator n=1 Tax=Ramlibacter sp. AN1133 TaxID=3133429 RepID=UPI0030BAA42A